MFKTYILYSVSSRRYYTGHTYDLSKRLLKHNAGEVRSTKAFKPWQIVYSEGFDTKQQAYAREMQIKSFKGGRAFKALLQ